jgi:hypothetical protein
MDKKTLLCVKNFKWFFFNENALKIATIKNWQKTGIFW